MIRHKRFIKNSWLILILAVLFFGSCTEDLKQGVTDQASGSIDFPAFLKDSLNGDLVTFNRLPKDTSRYGFLIRLGWKNTPAGKQVLRYIISQAHDSISTHYALIACHTLGQLHERQRDADSAMWYYKLAVEKAKQKNFVSRALPSIYRGIGGLYVKHSDYANGILNYNHAINIADQCGDSLSYITYLSEAGKIYSALNEMEKASDYFLKAQEFGIRTKNYSLIIFALNSLGDMHRMKQKFDQAIEFHEKAMEMNILRSGTPDETWACTSLGKVYTAKKEYEKAEKYFGIVLNVAKTKYIPDLESQCLLNLAQCEMNRGRYKSAVKKGQQALQISQKLSDISLQSAIAKRLADYYTAGKEFEKALSYYRIYNTLSDSVENSEQVKKQVEAQFKFKEENLMYKMEKNSQLLKAEEEKSQLESRRHRLTVILLTLILVMVAVFSIFIYRNLRKNRKQNAIITEQKTKVEQQKTKIEKQKFLIEEKQKEVLSSIHYAKRIQHARFATEIYVERALERLKNNKKPKEKL